MTISPNVVFAQLTGNRGSLTAANTSGAFVFGNGLAIVPFLYGGVVGRFHWLTERQFLDAVAVAMITPGPIVITAGFIGTWWREYSERSPPRLRCLHHLIFSSCWLRHIIGGSSPIRRFRLFPCS
jgi:hypothetical protein